MTSDVDEVAEELTRELGPEVARTVDQFLGFAASRYDSIDMAGDGSITSRRFSNVVINWKGLLAAVAADVLAVVSVGEARSSTTL